MGLPEHRFDGATALPLPRHARGHRRHPNRTHRRRHPRHAGRPRHRSGAGAGSRLYQRRKIRPGEGLRPEDARRDRHRFEAGSKPDAIVYEPHDEAGIRLQRPQQQRQRHRRSDQQSGRHHSAQGAPEAARADGAGKVYVNLENTNELVSLDAKRQKVTGRWPLPGCDGPTGLALDSAHRRSFSACANKKMSILDLDTGRSRLRRCRSAGVSTARSSTQTARNAFSANGEGTLTVVHEADPEHFTVAQTLADRTRRPHDRPRCKPA